VDQDTERRILEPKGEADRAALRCLLRMRSEGKPLAEMPAALEAETGVALPVDSVDRILRKVAGRPAPRAEGGDPEFFSGYLGGG
jgi:hypothetical protein